jgi:Zn-finger nucleic acid-binding protein
MLIAPLRLTCPACLGVALESASIATGIAVHHCGRCGGTWMTRGQAARLRGVPAAALLTLIRRADDAVFMCHGCHAPMERDAASCAACGWANALDCPVCGRTMRREARLGVTVDVCGNCTSSWLDHHELSSLWAVAAAAAVSRSSFVGDVSGVDPGSLLEGVLRAPEGAADLVGSGMEVTAPAADAGVQAVSNAPDLLASLPDLLGALAEIAGEAAGAVFGLIAEIICGIFSGIG